MTQAKPLALRGMRKMIADKMHASLQQTAQLSYHIEVDASQLLSARAQLKQRGSQAGFEDLIIVALCKALLKFPQFNATINDNTADIRDDVDVSVAIALENGLVAPTIFRANHQSVDELCANRRDLVARAKIGKLTVDEMTKGSITISNLGITRVRYFTPIINSPQMAIIGLGQIAKRPWVDEHDQLVVRSTMGVSLTTDHRFIDGGPAGEFLTELASALESPLTFTQ